MRELGMVPGVPAQIGWRRARCTWVGAVFAAALLLSAAATAQVAPSAYREMPALWAGGEFAYFNASFPYLSNQHIGGIGAFADLHLKANLGLEAEARFLNFGGYDGSTEANYLAGPRYRIRDFGKWQPYAQGLVGLAKIHYPEKIGDGTYFAIAPGAGVSYRLSPKFSLRVEYQYQLWLNSPGIANQPDHELMPNGVTVGIAYRIFR